MLLARGPDVGDGSRDGGLLVYLLVVSHILMGLHLVHRFRGRTTVRTPYDHLTGFPDRALFQDRVEVALSHARRSGTGSAVMYLDLDRFKDVNDRLGYEVGSELLQAVAQRLRNGLRDQDTIARMGADEFAILLSDVGGPHDAVAVAEKVLPAFETSFDVGGREIVTSASLGLALYPGHGGDAATLTRHADTAMRRAKSSGRNAYQLYTVDMGSRTRLKLTLESRLRGAIEQNELEVHYQPQFDVLSGRIVGVEALARWRDPQLGFVPPRAFIPLAEESGFILPLGAWVLETACRQAQQWREDGLFTATLSVNVSAEQLARQRLDDMVAAILERTHLPGDMLELELTESVLIRDAAAARATLHSLKELGVRCAFDDFGTGFSSLNYLAQMPIDRLKIDRSFVQHVAEQPRDRALVEAIIALAQSLEVQVIAEGVETDVQARFLRQHGCSQMQGYLFGCPMPADELARRLRDQTFVERRAEFAHAAHLGPLPAPTAYAASGNGAGAVPLDLDPLGLRAWPEGTPNAAAVVELLDIVCHNRDEFLDPQLAATVLQALEGGESRLQDRHVHQRSLAFTLAAAQL